MTSKWVSDYSSHFFILFFLLSFVFFIDEEISWLICFFYLYRFEFWWRLSYSSLKFWAQPSGFPFQNLIFRFGSSHLDVEIIGFVFFHVLKGFMVSTKNFTPGFKSSIHTIPLMVEEKDYVWFVVKVGFVWWNAAQRSHWLVSREENWTWFEKSHMPSTECPKSCFGGTEE